jgi:hypothetical protein
VRHPETHELALYWSGDLPIARTLAVGLHVRRCERCLRETEEFARANRVLGAEAELMPPGVAWDALAVEMRANIRLGLAAGECVTPAIRAPHPAPLRWLAIPALAAVLLVAVAGSWLRHNINRDQGPMSDLRIEAPRRVSDEVILKATRGGIGVERGGQSLALTHDAGEAAVVTVGLQGSLKARYIEEDGGQVTIHHVYTE